MISTPTLGDKKDHLAINSTTAVAGKAGFTLASAATAVVEFMAKWSNLYLLRVTGFSETLSFAKQIL